MSMYEYFAHLCNKTVVHGDLKCSRKAKLDRASKSKSLTDVLFCLSLLQKGWSSCQPFLFYYFGLTLCVPSVASAVPRVNHDYVPVVRPRLWMSGVIECTSTGLGHQQLVNSTNTSSTDQFRSVVPWSNRSNLMALFVLHCKGILSATGTQLSQTQQNCLCQCGDTDLWFVFFSDSFRPRPSAMKGIDTLIQNTDCNIGVQLLGRYQDAARIN